MNTRSRIQVKTLSTPKPSLTPVALGLLQRRSTSQGEPATAAPIVHEVLCSPGQPLNPATRAFFGPRFGRDLRQVQVQAPFPKEPHSRLTMNEPGDKYEQEANRVAEEVVQRQDSESSDKSQNHDLVQATEVPSRSPDFTPHFEARMSSSQGIGNILSRSTPAFFETRLGVDFGNVSIHNDSRAAEAARAMNARAFTIGRDIFFAETQYAPETREGQRLLAHELVHVIQQNGERAPGLDLETVSPTRAINWLFIMREEVSEKAAEPKPRINYAKAKKRNRYYAGNRVLGWEGKLAQVAGGAYKGWGDLWIEEKYDEFADAVAAYQAKLGWSGKDVDGVLGLKTWAQIAGLGEAMAGIRRVRWEESEYVCTKATEERVKRGHKIATGKSLTLPEDKTMDIFNAILQSVPARMLDVSLEYRGTGAAGALAYTGLGELVPEADIWAGKLKPGAAVQVWGNKNAYELLRAGEIEERGKRRRITDADANFYGTSFVFVRYDTETFERMLVRHYGSTEWKSKGSYAVWVAANVKSAEELPE